MVVVLLAGVGVVGLIGSRLVSTSRTAEPGYDGYRPGQPRSGTEPGTEPTAEPSGPGTPTTTDRPTAAPRTTASTTTPPRAIPVAALGDHPINSGDRALPAVTCTLPRFSQDAAGQDRFYRAGVPCLDAAWSPLLTAANLPSGSPAVETVTGAVSTPCGAQPAERTAFYCPGNNTIYMTAAFYSERFGARPGQYLAVLAHEYGHHVQGITGIFDAYWDRRYEAGPTSEAGLELSRRLELQASCYAGMFVTSSGGRGSVDRNITGEMVFALGNGGDDTVPGLPRDHGTVANNARWADQGSRYNLAWQCNTWLADTASVG